MRAGDSGGEVTARAVFLDRDGVLNELTSREGQLVSPRRLADFHIFEDAPPAARALKAGGFLLFVITNQPDVAREALDEAELGAMHDHLRDALPVDDIAYCPHDDRANCDCRKPRPGMLVELARRWNVRLDASYVVGDTWRDMDAGRAAGCHTILVERLGPSDARADARVVNLSDAVRYIQSRP